MLPLTQSNTNQAGCSPVSSNCVIWQGPDIPCIQLCKGDSISDVTAKLAQKICDLVDQFDITTFDTTCLNPVCPNLDNAHDLIQYLVEKICTMDAEITALQEEEVVIPECPSCLVDVNPVYNAAPYNLVDAFGQPITQMQQHDYLTFIADIVLANP